MTFNYTKLYTNIINSGLPFNEDQKLEQLRYQIVNFSVILAIFLVPLGMVFNYLAENFTLIYIEIFVNLFLINIVFLLRRGKQYYENTISLLTIGVLLFFDALFLFSQPEDIKFTWILVYTSIFIFFKGNKKGVFWILVFSLTLVILKLQDWYPIAFTWAQITYFFLVLGVLVGMVSFLQHILEANYKTILEQKKILAYFNTELEKKIDKEVSKNREKDKIFFQQSKMASMGEMLANIAHQWRQPLNTISVVAGGMKVHKKIGTLDDQRLDENIQSIEDTVQYLSQTINDFQDFFSSDKTKEHFDLKDSLAKDIRIFEPSLTPLGIKIHLNIQSCIIYTYKNQLSQVVLNILNNAKDALNLSTNPNKHIFLSLKTKEDEIIISIRDNAGGIKEEIMSKIFEPYFTTKHKSQGTGIGLFMTQEIVSRHLEGSIIFFNRNFEFENRSYTGAQFDIILSKETITNAY